MRLRGASNGTTRSAGTGVVHAWVGQNVTLLLFGR